MNSKMKIIAIIIKMKKMNRMNKRKTLSKRLNIDVSLLIARGSLFFLLMLT